MNQLLEDGVIQVFGAATSAPSQLAAFDRALKDGGVHDMNLITLSSVVPPNTQVVRALPTLGSASIGDRLYCVMATQSTKQPGAEAWAGIGWALDTQDRGGIFVEAHGDTEDFVTSELDATITSMIADRPYLDFAPTETEIAGTSCVDDPVCAVVLAAYRTTPWTSLAD